MPSGEVDQATLAERGELAELIRLASGGMSDRDRVVLELAYRQGLDGPELADALGVTPRNANTLVERLRDTIARSLGALLLCRRIEADPDRCPELAAIVGQGDREFTVLMRKRVARHIDGCLVCEEDRARMVSPAALLGATPIVIPAPAWLRERTLDSAVLPPSTGPAPVGPEDDASWWPPRDLDTDDLAAPSAPANPPRPRPGSRGRPLRAGVGAGLLLIGIGGVAMLAAPAAFRIAPADSNEPLTTSVTTTPSLAKRMAPSTPPAPTMTPTTLPSVTTTTTIDVTTPTSEDVPPPPASEPPVTHESKPSTTTEEPITTTRRPVTTRPEPTTEEPTESAPVTTPDEPTPKPTKPTKPPITLTKVPPVQSNPECPETNPNCQGGGGPVFN